METREAIRRRHSVRSFSPRQLDEETLQALLEAAYMAPVGMAAYDHLHLTVVQDADVLRAVDEAGMQVFGRSDIHMLYAAPTLLVLSARPMQFEGLERESAGCIFESVMLRAADLGVGSVYTWICGEGIRQSEAVQRLLSLPEGYTCVATLALGYEEAPKDRLKTPKQTIETTFVR